MADESLETVLGGVKERAEANSPQAEAAPEAPQQPAVPDSPELTSVLQDVKQRAGGSVEPEAQPTESMDEDALMKSVQQKRQMAGQASEAATTVTAQSVSRIATAFGHGVIESAGAAATTFLHPVSGADLSQEELDKYPINGEDKWQNEINQYVVRPAVQTALIGANLVNAVGALVSTSFSAAASAAQQAAVESGSPTAQKEIGYLTSPEIMGVLYMASPRGGGYEPSVEAIRSFVTKPPLPPEISKAIDNGIIAPSDPLMKVEAAQTTSAMAAAKYQAAARLVPEVAPPSISGLTKQADKQTHSTTTAASDRQDILRRNIDNLKDEQRQAAESSAPHNEEALQAQRDKVANPENARKGKIAQAKLDAMEAENAAHIEEATSTEHPDIAELRSGIESLDLQKRDLAEKSSAARKAAEETPFTQAEHNIPDAEWSKLKEAGRIQVGEDGAEFVRAKDYWDEKDNRAKAFEESQKPPVVEEPKDPVAPSGKSPEEQHTDIAADISKKAQAAGIGAEEAAAGAILQAKGIYGFFGRMFGVSAEEMYAKHGADFQRGKGNEAGVLKQENVKTPAFKKWFGKSKVVNAEGNPQMVYHATTKDFSKFDRSKKSELFNYGDKDSGGHFFSTENQSIDYYVAKGNGRLEDGANVIPVYLNIENPIELATTGTLESQAKLLRKAEADGHDGALLNGTEWVAFKPEQIKSVHNEGTFDSTNPDILKQAAKGSYNPITQIIKIMKGGDVSTMMHEGAHHFLTLMDKFSKLEDAPKALLDEMKVVRDWLKLKEGDDLADIKGNRRAHEQFARGFEQYLREGKAPSAELASVFAKMKQWFSQIYEGIKNLKYQGEGNKYRFKLTDEVRAFFDRTLAEHPETKIEAVEHEPASAATHEAEAKSTPLEKADVVADDIESDIIKTAERHNPEIANAIKEAESVAGEAAGDTEIGATAKSEAAGRGAAKEPESVPGSGSKPAGEGAGRGNAGEKPIRSKPVEKLFDKAGNIRLENLTNEEEARAALRTIANNTKLLDHEVIGDQEIAELAKSLGVKAKDINIEKLRQLAIEDNIPLAARVRAGREMMLEADRNVRELASKVENGTSADLANFAEAHQRFLMISETVSAITNQVGRALRAFQDISGEKAASATQLESLFQQEMGKTSYDMKDLAKLVSSKTDEQSIAKMLQDSLKPGFWSTFAEYRRCSILSGFVTHSLWLAGTGINLLYKPIVLDTLGGIRNEIGMVLGKEDTGSTITGGIQGLTRAITQALPSILSATGTAIRTGKTVLRPFEGELDTYLATGGIRKTLNINLEALQKATDSAFNTADYPELKTLQDKIAEATVEGNADKVAGLQLKLDEGSAAKKKEVASKIAAQMQVRLKSWGELVGEMHDFGSSTMAGVLAVGKNILNPTDFMKDKPTFEARREEGTAVPDFYVKGVPVAPIGSVMRGMSGRIYSSMHTFARETAANIETLQEARRMAVKEGLEGEALSNRVSELLASPTKELMKEVNRISNKQTLMSNESAMSKMAASIRNAIDHHTGTKIGSVLMPVVGVPAEAVRQTVVESSPFGLLDKAEREALAGRMGPVEQERAQVKMFAGTALIAMGVYMGQKGLSTPSPSINYNQEQERRDAGLQSGSVRIGDMMVSLNHVPVTGTLITLGADLAHIVNTYNGDDISDKLKPAAASAINNFLLHENALAELADTVDAVRGKSDVAGYLKNQAVATIVPAFIKQGNDLLDPYLRESKSFTSNVLSRIPGESETLAPKINALTGEPLHREPFHMNTAIPDPIAQQLMALHMYPTNPHPEINKVELSTKQAAEYSSVKGHILHNGLQMLMQGDGKEDFDAADVDGKRKMVQKIQSHASQCAKSFMYNLYPELLKDANDTHEAACAAETQ